MQFIKFSTSLCRPCAMIRSTFKRLAHEYQERVAFVEIELDSSGDQDRL